MNDMVVKFIRTKRIDSFQKLRFLLFLYQRPGLTGTCQELARQLYLGDEVLVRRIIADLQRAGLLVIDAGGCCGLEIKPEVRMSLGHLARAFADPLLRQEVLDQIRQIRLLNLNANDAGESDGKIH
ncbi:MAG: hypothetical protein Fur0044_00120 [Anaerolineae bacterium]